jgi:predicted DNA-binding transcriptional regulator AlpA
MDTAPLIDTGDIAALLGVTRAHVTDRLSKREDFPRPVVNISRKLRRWNEYAVRAWASGQRNRAAMSAADSR